MKFVVFSRKLNIEQYVLYKRNMLDRARKVYDKDYEDEDEHRTKGYWKLRSVEYFSLSLFSFLLLYF